MGDVLLALLWMFGPAAVILSLGRVLDWYQRRQDRRIARRLGLDWQRLDAAARRKARE